MLLTNNKAREEINGGNNKQDLELCTSKLLLNVNTTTP